VYYTAYKSVETRVRNSYLEVTPSLWFLFGKEMRKK
jgi:hypothetical protein